MTVTAEGVEAAEEYRQLALGCDACQRTTNHFAPALRADDLVQWALLGQRGPTT